MSHYGHNIKHGTFVAVTMQELSTEGLLWIQDLTLVDPYCILPVVLVATNLLNIEVWIPLQKQCNPHLMVYVHCSFILSDEYIESSWPD